MKNFKNILISLFLVFSIFSLSGCSETIESYTNEQEYLKNSYIKENGKMDPTVCSVFIEFDDIDYSDIDSTKTLETADKLQDWLDLNNDLEIIGMVGPVEQKETDGFYVVYKKSENKYNYYVFLSHDNFAYLGYCASIFVDNTNSSRKTYSDSYFYIGIGKKDTNIQMRNVDNIENTEDVEGIDTAEDVENINDSLPLENVENNSSSSEDVENNSLEGSNIE